ncbi:MAG: hypothetical protein HN348_33440 [Proteobacteria bacterium]|jgi:hypothetical protein|nr:hypothetical protein [Pseudomonadota bacterium]
MPREWSRAIEFATCTRAGCRASVLAMALAAPITAWSGNFSLGVLGAVSGDLPDPVSKEYANFGPGPSLQIPLRYSLSEMISIRQTTRLDLALGHDRVSWLEQVDGEEYRFYDDEHRAFLVAAAFTIGPEVFIPVKGVFSPYLGIEGGVAWVGTYHALGGEYENTQILLDPDSNELGNPRNIDPYTTQGAFLTDFHLGGRVQLNEKLALFVEAGYSMAFLVARSLKKAPAELDARREAYGWNAMRGGFGVSYTF